MILNAYAIYDRKGLVYHPPFYASQDGQAVRSLQDLVADPNTTIGRHPADYVLYRVGGYDDQSGQLLPASVLEHIIDASALVRVQEGLFDRVSQSFAQVPNGHGSPVTK